MNLKPTLLCLSLLAAASTIWPQETVTDVPAGSTVVVEQKTDSVAPPAAAPEIFTPAIKTRTASSQVLLYPKDPVAAAFFSLTLPGLGQAYVGKYGRAAFFGGLIVSTYLGIYLIDRRVQSRQVYDTFRTTTYPQGVPILVTIPRDSTAVPTNNEKLGSQLLGTAGILIWASAVVDAYLQAKKHNQAFFSQNQQKIQLRLARRGDGLAGELALCF